MKRVTLLFVLAAAWLIVPGVALAQTFPVVPGTLEIQGGVSAVSLPEETVGSVSAQPEARLGYFVAEGVMVQLAADARVWPLGNTAPSLYGLAANVLWFPNLGPRNRNVYLMAGGGGVLLDPPGAVVDSSIDPLLRGGLGFKVPMEEVGMSLLKSLHFTVEFRGDYVLADENSFLSGVTFAFSRIR